MSANREGLRRRFNYSNIDVERGIELNTFSTNERTPLITNSVVRNNFKLKFGTATRVAVGTGIAAAAGGASFAIADHYNKKTTQAFKDKVHAFGQALFQGNFEQPFPEDLKPESPEFFHELINYYNAHRNYRYGTVRYENGKYNYYDRKGTFVPKEHLNKISKWPYLYTQEKKIEEDKRGLTVPGYKYLGPGNSLNRGQPNNQIDEDAQEHDQAYDKAKTSQEVSEADNKFVNKALDHIVNAINLKENSANTIGAGIGAIGIGTKQAIEKHSGVIYPSVSGMSRQINPYYLSAWADWIKENQHNNFEGIQLPKDFYTEDQPLSDSPMSEGTKRKADSPPEEGPSKKGAHNVNVSSQPTNNQDPSSSGQTTALDVEMAMSLPGTGSGTSSGGSKTQNQEVYVIARPISNFGKKLSIYTKSHKFMIFAFANNVIGPAGTGTTAVNRLITTCLAEVVVVGGDTLRV